MRPFYVSALLALAAANSDYCIAEVEVDDAEFDTVGCECPNPFRNDFDTLDPFPARCKTYKTSNACNKWELDTNRKVISCDIAEGCMAVMTDPQCLTFYPSDDDEESDSAKYMAVGSTLLLASSLW
eukprot:CAMPEP_0170479608 /NCGR_PEP_ID=MMETSP0208-20121228/777_1 /TAXON_ID=197538 /ORGANISM="Strombidium inclinatum, Strain S3" /LENGTH=125 /DNA_ID=CAMNT_0010752031 /DNA_START=17 /DNA_END=391 /DNA_ORIENTATION=-